MLPRDVPCAGPGGSGPVKLLLGLLRPEDAVVAIERRTQDRAGGTDADGPSISVALAQETVRRSTRYVGCCSLRMLRSLLNAVCKTMMLAQRLPAAASPAKDVWDVSRKGAVAVTRRMIDFSEAHTMQSELVFADKHMEEGGW